jgi:hypothetical protein
MRKSNALLFVMLFVIATGCFATKAVSQAGTSPVFLRPQVAEKGLLNKVEPVYPPIAKAARVQGTVVLEAVIGKDGLVESLQVISGPQLLQQAAIDAVKQWRYQPYMLFGEAVEVKTTLNIVFTLGGGSPLQQSQSASQATAAPTGAHAQTTASENSDISVLMKSAQSGDAAAQSRLGGYYYLAKDYAHAAVWFRKAAEQGDAFAQSALGGFYFYGIGVPQNYTQAAIWYRNAAEQGDATAQSQLGYLYTSGSGLPQDDVQAAFWCRKAAEQGNATAQDNLGKIYNFGKGLPQDYGQAAIWYRKAAEQGNADSQMHLGSLYASGSSVPQDYAEAYFWLNIALAGNIEGRDFREELVKLRDLTANQLAPNKLQEVQSHATRWFAAHPPTSKAQ